jgi:hypothetical protein
VQAVIFVNTIVTYLLACSFICWVSCPLNCQHSTSTTSLAPPWRFLTVLSHSAGQHWLSDPGDAMFDVTSCWVTVWRLYGPMHGQATRRRVWLADDLSVGYCVVIAYDRWMKEPMNGWIAIISRDIVCQRVTTTKSWTILQLNTQPKYVGG